jgi:acetyl-CoA decarbonylase/synthase complex subunit delta
MEAVGMVLEMPAEKWAGKVGELILGATREQGGTRGKVVRLGGQKGLNFITYDGGNPNPPAIGMEVYDSAPDYTEAVKAAIGGVLGDPVAWARKAVDDWGAGLVCLRLSGTHPESGDRSPADSAQLVEKVLKAVPVPLIVYGCGVAEKDALVMQAVGEVLRAENCALGAANEENYKSMCVAAMGFNQSLVGFSNLDINLAKQLNILMTDFGLKKERILMDPLMAGLGYGLDYSYSVIERIRLAALSGDGMLQCPILCDTSTAWNAREATMAEPSMGDPATRGVVWEALTGMGAVTAGADLLIMRHPGAAKMLIKAMNDMGGGA